ARRADDRGSRPRRCGRGGDSRTEGEHPRRVLPARRPVRGRRDRGGCGADRPGHRPGHVQAGHRDPQLRAHPRVPRGRVLRRGQREGQPDGHRPHVLAGRRPARGGARHHAAERPRGQGDQAPELRLQGHDEQREDVPQDRADPRGHRRGGLPGPGHAHQVHRRAGLGRGDPRRGGAARGVGARHPRRRQGPEPRPRGVLDAEDHEADPRRGRRDRLHQEL
ncbi:MAG: hypothetical protein AVDCRST_MAG30-4540, partial [uncultured Solirubrobacteraceae bacterium]